MGGNSRGEKRREMSSLRPGGGQHPPPAPSDPNELLRQLPSPPLAQRLSQQGSRVWLLSLPRRLSSLLPPLLPCFYLLCFCMPLPVATAATLADLAATSSYGPLLLADLTSIVDSCLWLFAD